METSTSLTFAFESDVAGKLPQGDQLPWKRACFDHYHRSSLPSLVRDVFLSSSTPEVGCSISVCVQASQILQDIL